MAKKFQGLGRGLASLLDDNFLKSDSEKVMMILTKNLVPYKMQPRKHFDEEELKELSVSIKNNGIIQPIIVRKIENFSNKYEIVAGERRWRASKIAGLESVPVIVKDLTECAALNFSIIENIQRKDLSCIEEALSYKRLMNEFGYQQGDIAKIIGKSRSHIANILRILKLPSNIQDVLIKGDITIGHAKLLVNCNKAEFFAKKILEENLTVKELSKLMVGNKSKNMKISKKQKACTKSEEVLQLEALIESNIGLKVSIEEENNVGSIVIKYRNIDELDLLLRKLNY